MTEERVLKLVAVKGKLKTWQAITFYSKEPKLQWIHGTVRDGDRGLVFHQLGNRLLHLADMKALVSAMEALEKELRNESD